MLLVDAVSLIKRVRSARNWNTEKSWGRGVEEKSCRVWSTARQQKPP